MRIFRDGPIVDDDARLRAERWGIAMQPLPGPDQLGSARVLVRFMFRLSMILLCGTLAQTSYAYAVAVLLILSIFLCFFWGAIRRERMLGPSLTNWDEAMAYGCLASLALKFT